MFRSRNLRLCALVAAATMTIAGCSGSDSEATSSASESASEASASAAETSSASAMAEEEVSQDTPSAEDSASTEEAVEVPAEIAVSTYYGDETVVPYDPQVIVVLDYAALDTLDALGLGDRVVAIPSGTTVPPYLSSYESSAANVGNLFEADFEAINALEPDLIVAGGRSQGIVAELAEIAPTIDLTFNWGSEPFLESVEMNTAVIGEIFGIQDEVAAVLAGLHASIEDVHAQAADDGLGLVIMTSGGEVSAYGPDPEGRFDLVYNVLGITPAAEQVAIDTHGDAISFEFLADTNPDLLVVLDRDSAIGAEGESAQAILDNELVNGTNAVTNGKVVYVDTAKWYLAFGGLTSLQSMIDSIDSIVD